MNALERQLMRALTAELRVARQLVRQHRAARAVAEAERDKVLDLLKAAGVTKINGRVAIRR